MFGSRIRAGRVKSDWCVIDYCAGQDKAFLKQLLAVVVIILETFNEDTSERDVENILPFCKTKPMNLDSSWNQLKRLAMERRIRQTYAQEVQP